MNYKTTFLIVGQLGEEKVERSVEFECETSASSADAVQMQQEMLFRQTLSEVDRELWRLNYGPRPSPIGFLPDIRH